MNFSRLAVFGLRCLAFVLMAFADFPKISLFCLIDYSPMFIICAGRKTRSWGKFGTQ